MSRRSPRHSRDITKEDVKPWSIGQRIVVQVHQENGESKSSKAVIRDYDPLTRLTHIVHEDNHHHEDVDLLRLDEWDIATTAPLRKQMPFVPDNDWVPPKWKMGQRVSVQFDGENGFGQRWTACIDGYDPQSRRHHVNYGNTSEWVWATKSRVRACKKKCRVVDRLSDEFLKAFPFRSGTIPPPWEPSMYCLTDTFTAKSAEIHKQWISDD